jgi:hypothetical protein
VGCAALGVGAAKLLPPRKVIPDYHGLPGQSLGIMVWVERGMRIDYPAMQLDTAMSVENKFIAAQGEKLKEIEGTHFPIKPASIIRYQMDHPQIEAMQVVDVAPKLGVQRLLYIEVDGFQTRPQPGVELFRGEMSGSVKMIEITPDHKAKIVFQDDAIHAVFPKKSPPDGMPGADDYRIYLGTVDAFTTEVVHRFVTYEEEQD